MHLNPVLVIGSEHNGLGVIRNLGRSGIAVYCAVDDKRNFAIHSNYCRGYVHVPGVESDLPTLQRVMQDFSRRFRKKIYIHPTSDTAVLNLTRLIEDQPHYVASIPNQHAAETLIVKKKFYQSLEEQGIPHPTTCSTDEDDINEIAQKLSFPVFIKPIISPTFFQIFRVKGFVASNQDELRNYVQLAKKYGQNVVVQEIVLGPSSNQYWLDGYFDKESHLIYISAKQKLRQSSFFSTTSAAVSIPMNQRMERLKQIIVRYLASLKYHGCFGSEFKLDSKSRTFKLIEVNARTTWYTSLDTACGFNTILTAYREAMGESIQPQIAYKSGIYAINLIKDIQNLKTMLMNRSLSTRQVVASYMRKKHFLIYSKDDPLPFIQRPHIEIKKRFQDEESND